METIESALSPTRTKESKARHKIVFLKEKESYGMEGDPDYKPRYNQSNNYLSFLLEEGWQVVSLTSSNSGTHALLERPA